MADKSRKGDSGKRLEESQRFKYIGFEVFPRQPKNLFKNEAEKESYEEKVAAKRAKGDILRDDCSLTVERISMGERVLLTVACVMVIAALFFPFYSAYSSIEITGEEAGVETPMNESLLVDTLAEQTDSAVGLIEDTLAVVSVDSLLDAGEEITEATDDQDSALAATTTDSDEGEGISDELSSGSDDRSELITGLITRKKFRKEYSRLSGFGGLLSLGSVGSFLFSSGFVLIVTAILFIIYTLACLGLPLATLYGLYGSGAKGDALSLKIKALLKLSWWPIIVFFAVLVFSFIGAEYGFDSEQSFTSLGNSYGTGVLMDSLSYGIAISLAGFFLLAAKSSEI